MGAGGLKRTGFVLPLADLLWCRLHRPFPDCEHGGESRWRLRLNGADEVERVWAARSASSVSDHERRNFRVEWCGEVMWVIINGHMSSGVAVSKNWSPTLALKSVESLIHFSNDLHCKQLDGMIQWNDLRTSLVQENQSGYDGLIMGWLWQLLPSMSHGYNVFNIQQLNALKRLKNR